MNHACFQLTARIQVKQMQTCTSILTQRQCILLLAIHLQRHQSERRKVSISFLTLLLFISMNLPVVEVIVETILPPKKPNIKGKKGLCVVVAVNECYNLMLLQHQPQPQSKNQNLLLSRLPLVMLTLRIVVMMKYNNRRKRLL